MKKILAWVCAVAILFQGQFVYAADLEGSTEKDATAPLITQESTVVDTYLGDIRYFRIIPSSSATYTIQTTGTTDTDGILFDSSDLEHEKAYDDDSGELAFTNEGGNFYNFKMEVGLEAGTTYYLGVSHYHVDNEIDVTLNITGGGLSTVNNAPTLTKVDTLTGATEDSAYTITYGDIEAASDAEDSDGDPISFKLEEVSTGTLTKGGALATAGDTLGAGETFEWIPATNANGELNAFTVKAYDGKEVSATAVQVKLSVEAVNDAPTLTAKAPKLTSINDSETSNSGQTVESIIGTSIEDVDDGAESGIAITAIENGNGAWEYSTDAGVNWTAVGVVSNSSSLLLYDTDKVRFVPDGQHGTNASFAYHAWDRSSGTHGNKVDVSTNGGTTAFSTTTDTASITVNHLNQSPTISNLKDDILSYEKNSGARLLDQGSDATVTDSDSADFDGGKVIVSIIQNRIETEDILGIYNQGTGPNDIGVSGNQVTYGGTTIGTFTGGTDTNNLVITLNSNATPNSVTALLRNITYHNSNSTEPDTKTRTISISVDDGDEGISDVVSVTVNVQATNNAPTDITLSANSVAENVASGSEVGTFNTTDSDSDTFTYELVEGAGDTDNTSFTITENTLKLAFVPNYESKHSYSIRVRTTDDKGATLDKTFAIDITNVNEAPIITAPTSMNVTVNSLNAITGISFSDVDTESDSMNVTLRPTSGTLKAFSAEGVMADDTGAGTIILRGTIPNLNSYIAGGNVTFTTVKDNGNNVTLEVSIDDTGATGSGGSKVDSKFVTLVPALTTPTVTTGVASSVNSTTATVSGTVTASGGSTVTERGIVYGTSENPTISGTKTTDGTGTGEFSASLTGLTPNTTYYARAYAISSAGVSYGSNITFTSSVAPVKVLTASPNVALTENNLNGSTITLKVLEDTFSAANGTLDTGKITLNNPPAGTLTVNNATKTDATTIVLTLGYTRMDFDSDITDFSITVAADQLTSGSPLTTGNMTITAVVEELDAASVTMTVPVAGESPMTDTLVEGATSNADYTVSNVVWNEAMTADNKFKAGTVYTATITLTSKNGMKFQTAAFHPVVAGSDSVGTTTTKGTDIGNQVSFVVTFMATEAKSVSGISIKAQPNTLTYTEGEALSLLGLVATLTYNDGTTSEVGYADFSANGITIDLINGTILSVASHNGMPIKLRCNSHEATTNNLSVSALGSDTALKAGSTVKGQIVGSLGTPSAVLSSATAGAVTITASKAEDTSNAGSFITLFDKNDTNATVKVVKYASGAATGNFATDTAYANEAITDGDFFIIKVTAQDTTTVNYYRVNVTVTTSPSSDTALKAGSTVKGQIVGSLGTPSAVLSSVTAGTVTITASKAADTSNAGSFITLFDKNDTNATVKVVKYASGAATGNFATDTAYANEAITNGDFFIIKVTAQDTTTVNYYRVNVTVTTSSSSDTALKAGSTVKGQIVGSLGTPSTVLNSATAGAVTITASKAADTSNAGSFITLFDKNDTNATVKVVKYASGAATGNFATDTAYANEAITNGDFFIIKVTAQDTTTVNYYRVNVTVTTSSSGGSGGGSSSTTTTQPSQSTVVVVNGKEQNAGKETKATVDGKSTVTVEVDNKAVENKINEAIKANVKSMGNVLQVPVTDTKSEVAKVELTGDIVKKLEENAFDVSVKRDSVEYVIPAQEFTITKVAENLGIKEKDLADVKVEVKITKLDEKVVEKYSKIAKANGAELVFSPVEFEIVAKTTKTDGTQQEQNISKFSNYVERVMEIPAGIEPNKITTGIVFNADGTYSHVPTEVYQEGDKWYAKLNSLTNSDYSVIWNPVTVKSVENHWSKDAVNNMASRLVIFNTETFEPNKAITRADFAEYIVRALGIYREGTNHQNNFKDVSATGERTLAILIANEYGIVSGYSDGTFRGDNLITREEAMVMYQKAMQITKLAGIDENRFQNYTDYNQVGEWAKTYVKDVLSAHVFNGTNKTTISPKATLTYAESAQAIKNLLVESKLISVQ